jgi:heme A synthase
VKQREHWSRAKSLPKLWLYKAEFAFFSPYKVVIMHMLRHLVVLASAGYFCGWLMVEFGLATLPLVAGTLLAAVLIVMYLLLSFLVWLLPTARDDVYSDGGHKATKRTLLGYDGRGRLRIHSGERRR